MYYFYISTNIIIIITFRNKLFFNILKLFLSNNYISFTDYIKILRTEQKQTSFTETGSREAILLLAQMSLVTSVAYLETSQEAVPN